MSEAGQSAESGKGADKGNKGEDMSEGQPKMSAPDISRGVEGEVSDHPIRVGETYVANTGDVFVVDGILPDGTVIATTENPLKPGGASAVEFPSRDAMAARLNELGVEGVGRTARAEEAEQALAADATNTAASAPSPEAESAPVSRAADSYKPVPIDESKVTRIPVDVDDTDKGSQSTKEVGSGEPTVVVNEAAASESTQPTASGVSIETEQTEQPTMSEEERKNRLKIARQRLKQVDPNSPEATELRKTIVGLKYSSEAPQSGAEIDVDKQDLSDSEPVEPAAADEHKPHQDYEQEREQMQTKLDDLRKQYGLQMDKQTPEARRIKVEISALHKEIADSFEAEHAAEQPKTHREELYEELDEARARLSSMGNKKSPEAKELLKRIKEIHVEIAEDFENEFGGDEDEDEDKEESEAQKAEKAKRRQEVIDGIDKDIRSTPEFKKYRDALNAYAELKADNDTKGFPFGIGRKKHEARMAAAETELVNTKKALALAIVNERRKAGLYEGEEAEMKQAVSDDLFEQIRKIDPETRGMTNTVLLERQKNRNFLQRAAVKFGRFMNRGDKALKRYAKNAGIGFGAGVVKGAIVGIFGSWPVGIAVGGLAAGGLAAARYGSKTAYLDETLKTHIDDNKEAVPQLNDEQYRALLDSVRTNSPENARDDGKISDKLAREILKGSREAGEKEKNDARKKANKNIAAMSIGLAAGGLAGGFAGHAIHDAWNVAHAPVNPADVHPGEGTLPNDRYPTAIEAPTAPAHVDLGGARFPWNYAANHVGADNATAELRNRAAQAAARGHNVQWYRTVNGSSALRIDGSDKTQDVIDILWGNK